MKTNRLFYLAVSGDEITKINIADVNSAKQAIKDNRANYQLQAVWAPDVDTARSRVRQQKAEAYKPVKNLSGVIRTCDGWFQITDKNNRQSHRCFIYKPTCSPKKCKPDTNVPRETIANLSSVTSIYQEDFPFLQFKKINGKYKAFYSGTNDLYEINDIPFNAEFESPKSGYRLMLKIKPIQRIGKNKILPEQTSFTEPSQQALFGYTKITKTDLMPLADEAKNYSNAQEFSDAFYGKGGRMMSSSGEYHSERINRISQIDNEYNPKLAQFIKQYPYEAKKVPGLNKLTGKEKTVRIYRSATGEIRPGDWIALSSEYAKGHSRTKTHKLYTMEVPISDLIWAGTSAEEWFYAPNSAIKEFKNFDPKKFYEDVVKGDLSGFKGLAGFTATCIKFGKNKLGNRQCKKFAPTCGSADEGCRIEPALIPGRIKVRTKQDTEIEAKAIAQMLADDANQDLIRNKELLKLVLSYGGIAPHRGGFMKEEYSELPDKYKRKEGIPLDELAQEMGTDERALSDQIYEAEAQFRMLKEMRKGSTTKRFKSDDFIDEAWNRMESGRGFMGIHGISPITYRTSIQYKKHLRELQDKVLEDISGHASYFRLPGETSEQIEKRRKDFEKMHISEDESAPTIEEIRNYLLPNSEKLLLNYLKIKKAPSYNRLYNEFQSLKTGQQIKPILHKTIPEQTFFTEPSQMSLFGIPYLKSKKIESDITKNQIRIRVRNPRAMRDYFIRRSTTPGVQYAMAKDTQGKSVTQAVRFDKRLFSMTEANRWFKLNINRLLARDKKAYAY